MNTQQLMERLNREGLPKQFYDFNTRKDDVHVLLQEDGKWLVFYMERGNRYNLKSFDNEEAACEEFYNRIKDLYEFTIKHFGKV